MSDAESRTCKNCARFNVPIGDPQWRYIGHSVGECLEAKTTLRPGHARMSGIQVESVAPYRLKSGGGVLVDKDFGCIRFMRRPHVLPTSP